MNISLIAMLAKRLGAVCLTCVVLWHVAQHTGPRRGKAIVHVTQTDVVVDVDGQRFHVGSTGEAPVVCELEPGRHLAVVWRRGVLVGEESFTVESGEEVVLCPPAVGAIGGRPARTAKPTDPDGLAARAHRPRSGQAQN